MGILLSIMLNLASVDNTEVANTVDEMMYTLNYYTMTEDNKSDDLYTISNLNDKEIDKRLKGTFLQGTGEMRMY